MPAYRKPSMILQFGLGTFPKYFFKCLLFTSLGVSVKYIYIFNSRKFQKAKLEIGMPGNYLHNIDIVFTTAYIAFILYEV